MHWKQMEKSAISFFFILEHYSHRIGKCNSSYKLLWFYHIGILKMEFEAKAFIHSSLSTFTHPFIHVFIQHSWVLNRFQLLLDHFFSWFGSYMHMSPSEDSTRSLVHYLTIDSNMMTNLLEETWIETVNLLIVKAFFCLSGYTF